MSRGITLLAQFCIQTAFSSHQTALQHCPHFETDCSNTLGCLPSHCCQQDGPLLPMFQYYMYKMKVARQFNVSQSVISKPWNCHQQIGNVTDLPSSGCPRSTTCDTLNSGNIQMDTAILQHPYGPPSLILYETLWDCFGQQKFHQCRPMNFMGFKTRAVNTVQIMCYEVGN